MKIKSILIVASIGMMFAACSSEELQTQKAEGNPINFTANIQNLIPSVGTRVSDGTQGMITTAFPENTTIRVGLATYNGGSMPDTDSYLTNSSGSWTYASESLKQYLPSNMTKKRIAAFYPAPSGQIYQMVNNMTFFVTSPDQSTIDSYKSSDLLGAVVAVTQENAESVELNFKHIGAKVIVNIKSGGSNVVGYTITMNDVYRQIRMIATDDAINVSSGYQSDKGSVIFGQSSSAGQAAIIIPQTISADVALFDVTKDGVTYTFTTTESIILKSGYSYTFNLKFEETEISFENISIGEWGSDPEKSTIDGDLSKQTT